MSTASDALWRSYISQLGSFVGIPVSLFQVVPNLTAAGWEVLDTTGINPPTDVGRLLSERVYDWGDPMPRQGSASYGAGSSLYDMYRTVLLNLETSPPVQSAIAASVRYTMADPAHGSTPAGPSFPGYTVAPGLAQWYQAALQTLTSGDPPALDFTVGAGPATNEADLAHAVSAGPVGERPSVPSAAAAAAPQTGMAGGLDQGATALSRPFLPALAGARPSGINGTMPSPATPGGDRDLDGLTMRFTAQAVGTFTVRPERWFDASVLVVYGDQLISGSPLSGKALFGPGGLIAFRLSSIVVAFRRSVTIRGTEKQIAALKGASGPALGEVGGFAFAAPTIAGSTTTSLTLADNTNIPYVIAVGATPIGP